MKQKYYQKLCDSLNRECEVYYSTWSAETRIKAVDKWMYEGQMLKRQMFWMSFLPRSALIPQGRQSVK